MKFINLFCVFLSLFGLTSCDQQTIQPSTVSDVSTISGEVFVVLENRETLKLSLVNIQIVHEALVAMLLTNHPSWTTDMFLGNYPTLGAAMDDVFSRVPLKPQKPVLNDYLSCLSTATRIIDYRLEAAKQDLDAAQQKYDDAAAASDAKLNELEQRAFPPNLDYDNSWAVDRAAKAKVQFNEMLTNRDFSFINILGPEIEKRRKIHDAIQKDYFTLAAAENDIFTGFNQATLQTTTTDSDGKFAITIPNEGSFYIFVKASREAYGHSENYTWLVKCAGEKSQKIILANDNLFDLSQY